MTAEDISYDLVLYATHKYDGTDVREFRVLIEEKLKAYHKAQVEAWTDERIEDSADEFTDYTITYGMRELRDAMLNEPTQTSDK